jgi:glycosyltransferase involved in cell wall biosynthesis
MKQVKLPELSLFLPCYNEARNLQNTVDKTLPILKQVAEKWELIIVDDGSKDDTGKIAKSIQKSDPDHIKIITHNPNRGYGAAFKSGFYSAKYEWITFIDADGQFDFNDIHQFIDTQQRTKSDIVVGYYLKRKVPFIRILGSKVWQIVVYLLFGFFIRDTDCGFKLVNKKVFDTIPQLEAERGPFITSEFFIKSQKAGFKISEVGVHHFARTAGDATGTKLNVIISGFKDLFRLWLKLKNTG